MKEKQRERVKGREKEREKERGVLQFMKAFDVCSPLLSLQSLGAIPELKPLVGVCNSQQAGSLLCSQLVPATLLKEALRGRIY